MSSAGERYLDDDSRASILPCQTSTGFAPVSDNVYKLYYETYHILRSDGVSESTLAGKVVGIMGLGAACFHWYALLRHLMEVDRGTHMDLEVVIFDNRGHGKSSVPKQKDEYSTEIMARDVLAVLDHLQWSSAHLIGHSMGGMIALKAAAMHPERVLSTTAISSTAGGIQMLPRRIRGWQFLCLGACASSVELENTVYINLHFTPATLNKKNSVGKSYHKVLLEEYIERHHRDGPSRKEGMNGQINAILKNRLSPENVWALKSSGRTLLIHGYSDCLADPSYAMKMGKRLGAMCVMVPGAHLITRESVQEVTQVWLDFLRSNHIIKPKPQPKHPAMSGTMTCAMRDNPLAIQAPHGP